MDSKKGKRISRRKFINMGIKGYAGIGLSPALMAISSCAPKNVKTVHGPCYHDCPDACSWTVTAVDGKITQFEASKSNPYTAGKLCDKMDNFPNDVTFHPDRVLRSLKRIGKKGKAEFEPVSWEQATREIAARLKSIIDQKGGEAVLPYSYAGHNWSLEAFGWRPDAFHLRPIWESAELGKARTGPGRDNF